MQHPLVKLQLANFLTEPSLPLWTTGQTTGRECRASLPTVRAGSAQWRASYCLPEQAPQPWSLTKSCNKSALSPGLWQCDFAVFHSFINILGAAEVTYQMLFMKSQMMWRGQWQTITEPQCYKGPYRSFSSASPTLQFSKWSSGPGFKWSTCKQLSFYGDLIFRMLRVSFWGNTSHSALPIYGF